MKLLLLKPLSGCTYNQLRFACCNTRGVCVPTRPAPASPSSAPRAAAIAVSSARRLRGLSKALCVAQTMDRHLEETGVTSTELRRNHFSLVLSLGRSSPSRLVSVRSRERRVPGSSSQPSAPSRGSGAACGLEEREPRPAARPSAAPALQLSGCHGPVPLPLPSLQPPGCSSSSSLSSAGCAKAQVSTFQGRTSRTFAVAAV